MEFEPLRPIDATQLIDSNRRQKRQKGHLSGLRYAAGTRR